MPRSRGHRSRRPWSDGLPHELLGVILLHLACFADRVYFGAVCRAWRSAARDLDSPPRQLPWLLLPSPPNPSFFSLQSGAIHRLYLPESIRGARLCGSHNGGWVTLVINQWQGYAAVNILSGMRVPLPDRLKINLPDNHEPHINTSCEHPMVIRTVTFSATPTLEGCLAAAHVSSATNLAFWRSGMDDHWLACGLVDGLEDIIYHVNDLKQGFHILSNKEDIKVYTPDNNWHAPLRMSCSSYQIQKRLDYIPDQALPKSLRVTRYLVESRGKLLMVMRRYTMSCGWRRTCLIKIFEMKLGITPDGSSDVSWVELHTLPGQVLFLGRGCSKAIEVSGVERLQPSNIHYLDDATFDISLVLNNGSKYTSTDMFLS